MAYLNQKKYSSLMCSNQNQIILFPDFIQKKGSLRFFLTLESCKVTFKHLTKLDSGNLVDIDQITYVTESPFAITAYFPTGTKTANVSRVKKKYIEHLIKKT